MWFDTSAFVAPPANTYGDSGRGRSLRPPAAGPRPSYITAITASPNWLHYLHANQCRLDRDGSPVRLDGRPVSVMEWLSAQAKVR